ncbi:MAG: hypothetical protein HOQ43_15335, partial [Glycomyces artemisiae]|nr:hypothetical protein [Glycomyces artemisiae]
AAPNPPAGTAPSDAAATPTTDTPAPGATDAPAAQDTPKAPETPAGSESPKTSDKPSGEAPPKGTTEPNGTDAPKEETPKEGAQDYAGVGIKVSLPSKISVYSTVHAKVTVTNNSTDEVGAVPLRAVIQLGGRLDGQITGSYRQADGTTKKVTFLQSPTGAFSAGLVVTGGQPGAVTTVDLALTFNVEIVNDLAAQGSLTVGVDAPGGSQGTQDFRFFHGTPDMERMKLSLSGLPSKAERDRPFTMTVGTDNPTDSDFRPIKTGVLFLSNADDPGQSSAHGLTRADAVVEVRAADGTFSQVPVQQYAPNVLIVAIPDPGGMPHQKWSTDVRVTIKGSAPTEIRDLLLEFGMGTGYGSPKAATATLPLGAADTKPNPDTSTPGSTQSRADNVSAVTTPTTVPTGALPKTGASGDIPALVGAGGLLVLAGACAVTASRARRRPQS